MTIQNHIVNELGATHYYALENATRLGSGSTAASFTASGGNFSGDPICVGVDSSYRSSNSNSTHGLIGNSSDINSGSDLYRKRSTITWFATDGVNTPTCVYEQGGGTNNFAIVVGVGRTITFQAADAGQPFLIAQSSFQAEAGRAYFVTAIWEHHSQHSGSGNRVLLYVNGVFQEAIELTGTDVFPSHTGDIAIGNTNESLKSYNDGSMAFAAIQKNLNLFAFFNDKSLTEAETRGIFERTTKATHTITGTVAEQQAAIYALAGTTFQGNNCCIRIIQATDATDYTLVLDNLTFVHNASLRDIDIQYVGSNTLTLENANGSNAAEVSTPVEVDLKSIVHSGGGTINIVDNCLRVDTAGNIEGSYTKAIITSAGNYHLEDAKIPVVENNSGGLVTLTATQAATIPTLIETDGSFDFVSTLTIREIEGRAISLIGWDASGVGEGESNDNVGDAEKTYNYLKASEHIINTSGKTKIRIAVDMAGYYAKVIDIPITSVAQEFNVSLTLSPNVDVNADIDALISATTTELLTNPFGIGFDALRATVDQDFSDLSADQWRRWHDYLTETPSGLEILGRYNYNADQLFQTNASGISVVLPVLIAVCQSTEVVKTQAFVDQSVAQAIFPLFDYSPRNSDNVKIETATANPILDYEKIDQLIAARIAPVAEAAEAAEDHARFADQQTKGLL